MNRNSSPSTSPPENLLSPLRTIYRWRKRLFILGVATFLLTAAVSWFFLANYYEATTSFIALSPDQSSPELLFGGQSKPQTYGNADDIDRLLALSESNELVDYMISTFDLYAHYDIDSSKRKAPVSVRNEFFSLYEVTKTPRDAIEISVEDTDPQLAAAMANAARERVGILARQLQRNAQGTTMESLRGQIEVKVDRLNELNDSLEVIRENSGIYNHVSQSEVLGSLVSEQDQSIVSLEGRIAAYRDANTRDARDSVIKLNANLQGLLLSRTVLDSQLTLLNGAMSVIENLNYERNNLNSIIARDRDRMKQFQTAYESPQKSLAVIQEADVPIIKSRPKRMILVAGITFLIVFLGALTAIAIENSRRYPWREWLQENE